MGTYVAAFLDELEKVSADLGQLFAKMRKLKGVNIGPSPRAKGTRSLGDLRHRLFMEEAPWQGADIAAVGGGAVYLPSRKISKHPRALAHQQAMLQGLPKRVATAMLRVSEEAEKYPGQVYVDPRVGDMATRWLPGGGGKALTGPGRRALGAVFAGHELAERGVRSKEVAPLASHLSPKVLMIEHNLLSRATGRGSEEAVARLRALREATGEADVMRRFAERALNDPRAKQFFEPGEKIPKAMRKALTRKAVEGYDFTRW